MIRTACGGGGVRGLQQVAGREQMLQAFLRAEVVDSGA